MALAGAPGGLGRFVEIPGTPTLTRTTGLPPIRVPLPLTAQKRANVFYILVFSLLSLFGLVLVFVAVSVFEGGGSPATWFIAMPVTILAGLLFLLYAITYFLDLARTSPIVIIDADSIWDHRATDAPLAWADVSEALVLFARGDVIGVRLTLRHPVGGRRLSLGFATLHHLLRRRRDELVVAMDFFRNRRTMALATTALVRRHGGRARDF